MPATVRVVSYNVHGLGDDRGALNAVVRTLAPDLVVVQEAPRRFRWRARCAEIAHSWEMVYAAGGLPSLGNLIVVSPRLRVRETWCIRYPLTPGRHMRGAAFARCTVGDVSFTVAASHLATDDGERDSQAQRLDAELAAIAGPVILGIDANETAAGASWKRLAAGRVDVGAAQDQPTFSATNPKRRIDGIFVTPDMTVESFQVISSEATRSASDHLPLVADVIVPS
jgi:endonuclease/exonuclease/phosphatase family metal-dependent hydrolase